MTKKSYPCWKKVSQWSERYFPNPNGWWYGIAQDETGSWLALTANKILGSFPTRSRAKAACKARLLRKRAGQRKAPLRAIARLQQTEVLSEATT
jgi:hypothetical protein